MEDSQFGSMSFYCNHFPHRYDLILGSSEANIF